MATAAHQVKGQDGKCHTEEEVGCGEEEAKGGSFWRVRMGKRIGSYQNIRWMLKGSRR